MLLLLMLPRTDVNIRLSYEHQVSRNAAPLIHFVSAFGRSVSPQNWWLWDRTMISHIFKWLKKARLAAAAAASVGCILLQASMSHGRGGSENACVNDDTGSALALGGLDVWFQRHGIYHLTVFHVLPSFWLCSRAVWVFVSLLFSRRPTMLDGGLWASTDVRECMSVAPPTEWACIVLWLIPPHQRLDGIQQTNTGLNTSCSLSSRTECKSEALVNVTGG